MSNLSSNLSLPTCPTSPCLSRMNIYVYLHHPGQFYDSDSKTKIYVNQGKMLFIDLTYELSRVRVREHAVKPLHGVL